MPYHTVPGRAARHSARRWVLHNCHKFKFGSGSGKSTTMGSNLLSSEL
jgi:hypothetical protein